MRYLFLIAGNEWNGSARAFTQVARELGLQGVSATVAVPLESNVERIVSAKAVVRGSRDAYSVVPIRLRGLPFLAARRIKQEIVADGIDVVFVNSERMQYVAALACRMAGRGVVIRRFPPKTFEKKGLMRLRSRIAARLASTSYLFSTKVDAQRSYIPRAVRHTSVTPIGVHLTDAESLTLDKRAKTDFDLKHIVCINDNSSRSRASIAIRALAMLIERHPYLRLTIVGESRYDEDLRMQAAALRVLNLVSFVGNREDELEIMKGAWLGWVVSEGDTGAFATLDFMSVHVPVLADDHSVADNYVLTSITGILFPSKDPNSVAALMAEIIRDTARLETMGEAANTRVRRDFTIEKMVGGFVEIANQTVKHRR